MAKFGAFCFAGTGHIHPMTALARRLQTRGHEVILFGIPDIEARVRAAGIGFCAIGESDYPLGTGRISRLRNRLGMRFLSRVATPIYKEVNAQRSAWGLKPLLHAADALSPLAQITQLPAALEFKVDVPAPLLHYTGPFVDQARRSHVEFPWHRLDGRPLVYASLGTLQNGAEDIFRKIAQACVGLDLQLVISLGGGLDPASLGTLPGDPLVVRYAPQLDIVKRAAAVITHAGLNTTLESLAEGVPLVCIPLGNDQPGVAARVAAQGAGVVISRRKITAMRLRSAIDDVLSRPHYRAAACRLRDAIRRIDGLDEAANIIETALKIEISAPTR